MLTTWYKRDLKEALINQVYTNRSTVKGINLNDPSVKEQIYQQYLKAYKKGVFNYIKENTQGNGQMVPRKYFSGGTSIDTDAIEDVETTVAARRAVQLNPGIVQMRTLFMPNGAGPAMKSDAAMNILNRNLTGGLTVYDHQEIHRQGQFNAVITSIVEGLRKGNGGRQPILVPEVQALNGQTKNDLLTVVRQRGPISLFADSEEKIVEGEMRIVRNYDFDILVIKDERFASDHVGRGNFQLAIYGRTESKIQHELSELRSRIAFAKNKLGMTDDEIRNGLLGQRINEYAQKNPVEFRVLYNKWDAQALEIERQTSISSEEMPFLSDDELGVRVQAIERQQRGLKERLDELIKKFRPKFSYITFEPYPMIYQNTFPKREGSEGSEGRVALTPLYSVDSLLLKSRIGDIQDEDNRLIEEYRTQAEKVKEEVSYLPGKVGLTVYMRHSKYGVVYSAHPFGLPDKIIYFSHNQGNIFITSNMQNEFEPWKAVTQSYLRMILGEGGFALLSENFRWRGTFHENVAIIDEFESDESLIRNLEADNQKLEKEKEILNQELERIYLKQREITQAIIEAGIKVAKYRDEHPVSILEAIALSPMIAKQLLERCVLLIVNATRNRYMDVNETAQQVLSMGVNFDQKTWDVIADILLAKTDNLAVPRVIEQMSKYRVRIPDDVRVVMGNNGNYERSKNVHQWGRDNLPHFYDPTSGIIALFVGTGIRSGNVFFKEKFLLGAPAASFTSGLPSKDDESEMKKGAVALIEKRQHEIEQSGSYVPDRI